MHLLRGAAGKARPRLLARCAMSAVARPPEVVVTKENGLGRLTLARSKQLNALGAGMRWQLQQAWYRSSGSSVSCTAPQHSIAVQMSS